MTAYDDTLDGDPRRCPRHPNVQTSSADGMFDAPCGVCEAEMEEHANDRKEADGTFRVPDVNLAPLQEKIAALNKRARRLHVPEIVLVIEREEAKREVREDSLAVAPDQPRAFLIGLEEPLPASCRETGRAKRFHYVRIVGESPKLNGWTFAATLNHIDAAEGEKLTILKAVPGETVPEQYRAAKPEHCDHCHTARRRIDTFVLHHDDGRWAQVGRNCLADFLGHQSPEALAARATILIEAAGFCDGAEEEGFFGGGGGRYSWTLDHFLTTTARSIRERGWLSRKAARERDRDGGATAEDVTFLLTARQKDLEAAGRDKGSVTDEDKALGQAAAEWAEALHERADLNDYLYNVSVVGRAGVVESRTTGIAASIVPAYQREQEREVQQRRRVATDQASRYQGTPKKREVFTGLVLERIIATESDWGVTHIHKFRSLDGHLFTWFATREQELKVGACYDLKATVKAHEEYRGTQQTVITRCAVVAERETPAIETSAAPTEPVAFECAPVEGGAS